MTRHQENTVTGISVDRRMVGDVLLFFVKQPVAGEAMTRLARTIGPERAVRAYRQIAEAAWAKTRSEAFDRWVAYTPASQKAFFKTWLPGADRYLSQVRGDIGKRMETAMAEAFEAGSRSAGVVGTDLPDLDAAVVERSLGLLSPGGAVLCPSFDGGFWLLALSHPARGLFHGVHWASDHVYLQTRRSLESAGFHVVEGPRLRDVDTAEDLAAYPHLWESCLRD